MHELSFIQHIPMTESNYSVAYSELNKRFKYNTQILKAHWDAIDNLSGINSTNPEGFRTLIDTFSKNLNSIKNFKVPADVSDSILVYVDGKTTQ